MMRYARLKHQFVTTLPDRLEPGVLYVSIEYTTVAHLCCCGCGVEVVTPLTPTDWKMTFDGETISLWPSIGNWNEACRSHYVIERGRVIESLPWTDQQIKEEWRRDRAAKAKFYSAEGDPEAHAAPPTSSQPIAEAPSLWARVKDWFSNLKS